jgi:hypothetical protein
MSNEKDALKNFAKLLGVESVFEQIEAKKSKEEKLLEDLKQTLGVKTEQSKVVEEVPAPVVVKEEVLVENPVAPMPELPVETIVTQSVKALYQGEPKDIQKEVDKIPDLMRREIDALKKSITDLHSFARRQSQMGGGGEVNLRMLDDVNRSAIENNKYLRYDAPTKKFTFDSGHKNNFYGMFQSTQTQVCGANTATALTYNITDFSYGVTLQNNSQIHIETPGLYNAQFSVQLTNSGNDIDSVYIWLRQEGTDVIGSTGKINVPAKHGKGNGALLIGWNFYVQTTVPNEHFEFMWFTPDETHITIPTLPEQAAVPGVSPYIPSTASVVLTVSPVKVDSN